VCAFGQATADDHGPRDCDINTSSPTKTPSHRTGSSTKASRVNAKLNDLKPSIYHQ